MQKFLVIGCPGSGKSTFSTALHEITGLPLKKADDLIDGTQNLDSFAYVSSALKTCAISCSKIANDLRLMSSGPRCGFEEINLPPMQNGSSIMPGKVNPVIPEVMSQAAFCIIGNDTTITYAAEAGQLELNAVEPVLLYRLFDSLDTLKNGLDVFRTKCVDGITVNADSCREDIENSIGIVTALCPYIGYAESARIAKRALKEGRNVRDVIKEEDLISPEKLSEILDPQKMI